MPEVRNAPVAQTGKEVPKVGPKTLPSVGAYQQVMVTLGFQLRTWPFFGL